jgi:alanine racemase
VASVDEGCQLRSAGIKTPVLILSPAPFWAIDNAIKDDLELTVASLTQVRDIEKIAIRNAERARVHLKVDSGMHRLGIAPAQSQSLVGEILKSKHLDLVSIFSHLARAGHEETTLFQLDCFKKVTDDARLLKPDLTAHLASSEATRMFPDTHFDMVRVGLYLYGLEGRGVSETLIPAMSVKARINHITQVRAGDSVGYNLTWQAGRDSRLAVVPIGYADGVDRRLSNRMEGLLSGRGVKQVGLISMDQMLFDITDLPEAQEGDVITLIGSEPARQEVGTEPCQEKSLFLATWADMLDTITYELAARLRARLPRIYTRARVRHAQLPSPMTSELSTHEDMATRTEKLSGRLKN